MERGGEREDWRAVEHFDSQHRPLLLIDWLHCGGRLAALGLNVTAAARPWTLEFVCVFVCIELIAVH